MRMPRREAVRHAAGGHRVLVRRDREQEAPAVPLDRLLDGFELPYDGMQLVLRQRHAAVIVQG